MAWCLYLVASTIFVWYVHQQVPGSVPKAASKGVSNSVSCAWCIECVYIYIYYIHSLQMHADWRRLNKFLILLLILLLDLRTDLNHPFNGWIHIRYVFLYIYIVYAYIYICIKCEFFSNIYIYVFVVYVCIDAFEFS